MSKIDELLKNEKVEWKKLGEVCEIKTGQQISKQIISNNVGDYPVINSGKEPLGYINTWNTENDPIGITTRGAGVGSITYQEGRYFRGNLNYSVTILDTSRINTRFLYHTLINFQENIFKLCTFNGIPALNSTELKKLIIPIPSIETQEKIVKILDKFTNYVTELQTELQKRTRQYEYYRDMLLSEEYLSNKIFGILGNTAIKLDWKTLGEVCEILDYKRKPITKSKRILGDYPYYGANGIQDYVNDYIFDGTFILMGEDGSVIRKDNTPVLHWIENKKIWVNNHAHVLSGLDKNYHLKYIYYYLSGYNVSDKVKGTPPKINQENLKNIKIPIVPLWLQEKVVEVLDRFTEMLNDTNGLLPEEIEKRQKQYEYYREKLLTFDLESDSTHARTHDSI